MTTDNVPGKPCRYSGLGITDRRTPSGVFLARCECGAVHVIEGGSIPVHAPDLFRGGSR